MNEFWRRQRARLIVKHREHLSWSRLSAIGKSPISKLIVFAPIVAQILIHQPEVVLIRSLDLRMLDWAYWSLIFFSVGQIVYTFACPDDIKSYPERHEYISSIDRTETDERLREDALKKIRKSFSDYGGSLVVDKERLVRFLRDAAWEKAVDQNYSNGKELSDPHVEIELLQEVDNLSEALIIGAPRRVNWKLLENNLHLLNAYTRSDEHPRRGWASAHNFGFNIDKYATSSHWRVNVLNDRYRGENLSRWKWRTTCAVLYMFGVSYFLFTGVSNVLRVISRYY